MDPITRSVFYGCVLLASLSFDDVISVDDVGGEDCPDPCNYYGQVFCGHIPCPLPPCDRPLVLTPGDCCEHCPNETSPTDPSADELLPTVGIKNVTAHYCPYPCTIGNETVCYPPPCPFPGCVDPAKNKPTDCCSFCPNGPNCQGPNDHIIKFDHWQMIGGKNCTCNNPGQNATCV